MDAILSLSAVELRDRLARGALRAADLAEASIKQIEAVDPQVQAWAWFDADFVRQQAKALDSLRGTGRPVGPLHGLPVAIKDVVDTVKIPTENGTVIDKGRVPVKDAWIVGRLKQAGALIMGKTVTTELALFTPGKTRNPHDPARSPGGSSSGSAAAVATRMVPLAIGTQTAGSVIRPAAFCGVTGFKPTFGSIPRNGVLPQAPSLDTIGVFANSPEDAALLADVLFGQDDDDPATRLGPAPRLLETAQSEPPLKPVLAFSPPPHWDHADEVTHAAFAELREALAGQCDEIPLPPVFDQGNGLRETVQLAELAKSLFSYERRGRDQLSPGMQKAIDAGKTTLARDYLSALDARAVFNAALDEIFDRYDAILTAAAPSPPPLAEEGTGDPIYNGLWTFCGVPAISLPLLAFESGLPMGVQLIGRRGDDGRLLRTARWLVGHLRSEAGRT